MNILAKIGSFINPPMADPSPTKTPAMVGGQVGPGHYNWSIPRPAPTPTPTPTPAPNIDDIISRNWGKDTPAAHEILSGENSRKQYGREVDIPNRINPQTGKWDPTAPIMMRPHPITGQMIPSIDRGLFRINNVTFYDYQNRYPALLKRNDIGSWDDMLDPNKNSIMAKIIYDNKGKSQWYGAK